MKKIVPLSFLLMILCVSCSAGGSNHNHCDFNQMVETSEYFVHGPTCDEGTTYYYSCRCGKHAEATFSKEDALGHIFDGGEFVTSDEQIMVITVRDDEVAVLYTCARCDKTRVREDVKKASGEGHKHFAHSYTYQSDNQHTGTCAICSESITESCNITHYHDGDSDKCHKCDHAA